jgi:hypothetical protein
VILIDGAAAGYLRRGERELLLFLPDTEPLRSHVGRSVARALLDLSGSREAGHRGLLIAEINGVPAATHPGARLFVEAGFLATAMGLQARPPMTRYGTGVAEITAEVPMADNTRGPKVDGPDEHDNVGDDDLNRADTISGDSDVEHDRVRSSNDRDQALEREGVTSRHNQGYDEAVKGATTGPTDPDSAFSEVDRNDTIDE